jgi:predicted homoserine dehydrogenase-like protein
MTAVCNATGLVPQPDGLTFPPASRFELAELLKPKAAGGQVSHAGTTEVTSSLTRQGGDVSHHLSMGTFVVIRGDSDYVRHCFGEYHMLADSSGEYASLYRPTHMIGLELGQSVASVALRREPTGAAIGFHSDVVATAKRALKTGEILDGEGGQCVWGRQAPAAASLAAGYLPIGLAQNVKLQRDVAAGQILTRADVVLDEAALEVRFRAEMETQFAC